MGGWAEMALRYVLSCHFGTDSAAFWALGRPVQGLGRDQDAKLCLGWRQVAAGCMWKILMEKGGGWKWRCALSFPILLGREVWCCWAAVRPGLVFVRDQSGHQGVCQFAA